MLETHIEYVKLHYVVNLSFPGFMTDKSDLILKPGMGVDLVFDLDSLSPSSRPSIVFDCDNKKRWVVVAQPTHRLGLDSKDRQMHISSLIRGELSSKVRLGYSCKILKILNGFKLANRGKADALLFEYFPPIIEINIRAAYRFHPNPTHDVMGKLIYNDEMFYSGRHFKFHNISLTGVGLLIPKKILKKLNPLIEIHSQSRGKIGIILKQTEESDSIETIDCEFEVIRTNYSFNERSGYAGCTLINLRPEHENILNKFIHNAQLHEIRKFNRLK